MASDDGTTIALPAGTSRKLVVLQSVESFPVVCNGFTFNGTAHTGAHTAQVGDSTYNTRVYYYDVPDATGAGNYALVAQWSDGTPGTSRKLNWMIFDGRATGAASATNTNNNTGSATIATSVSTVSGDDVACWAINAAAQVAATDWDITSEPEIDFTERAWGGSGHAVEGASAAADATETVNITWEDSLNGTAGTKHVHIVALGAGAPPGASAATTGTLATGTKTQADVVAGGQTIILTLTGDTFVASGATFDAQRQAIINGLDAASSPSTGWNTLVRDTLAVTTVVRTSATVVTITLPAIPTYAITADEVITCTIPASALTGAVEIVSSPTITIHEGAVLSAYSGTTNGSGVLTTNLTSDQANVRVLTRAYINGTEVGRITTLPA